MNPVRLKASDVMTRRVITVTENVPIRDVVGLMLENHFSGLPVVDSDGGLMGIITEGDLLRRVELGTAKQRSRWAGLLAPGTVAQDYVVAHGRCAADVMTREVLVAAPDTALDEIVALMEQHHVKRIPVVDQGRVVGIVSRADVLKALARLTEKPSETSLPDEEIQRRIMAEIRSQPWSSKNSGVTVKNGIACLHGVVYDYREHVAMRVAAANAPGVKGIRDELQCIEPISGLPVESPEEIAGLPFY